MSEPDKELLARALKVLERTRPTQVRGRVNEVTGLVIKALVPGIKHGELVQIGADASLQAEVVGFKGEEAILMPLGEPRGIGPDSVVLPTGRPLAVKAGMELLGRVLDGLGRPIDGAPEPRGLESWEVDRRAPDPLSRPRITRPLVSGVRAIDALITLGEGQRVGLFAGSGVGKSTLLGQLARSSSADVNVVCLVGERGREVRDFIEESLGEAGMRRSVVVCATSDAPSLVRLKSAQVATALAEWFRDRQGKRVLLLMDSLTRFARAQREVGLAAGEPPARHGYPPSVFAALPRLLERTGNAPSGSITAIYTVLVAGGDLDEPISDEVRGILDGHIILERSLGERNRWPAIDVLSSLSRLMPQLTSPEHRRAAARVREHIAAYEEKRDLILVGAYRAGSDRRVDQALAVIDRIETFLGQAPSEVAPLEDTMLKLLNLGV